MELTVCIYSTSGAPPPMNPIIRGLGHEFNAYNAFSAKNHRLKGYLQNFEQMTININVDQIVVVEW